MCQRFYSSGNVTFWLTISCKHCNALTAKCSVSLISLRFSLHTSRKTRVTHYVNTQLCGHHTDNTRHMEIISLIKTNIFHPHTSTKFLRFFKRNFKYFLTLCKNYELLIDTIGCAVHYTVARKYLNVSVGF